ncbi:hypothetical protein QYM36_009999 [Artemia franciscana]|uniref:deoxyribose-phosphate aldolase n=1 Tax=Artemia franciscana TaxID=6661 RepID=A0AA88L3D5_ARTSF|nr:hypothetical protein QYM36_009999 [Artemia franciscana]
MVLCWPFLGENPSLKIGILGDDSFSNVQRLCHKAARPLHKDILTALDLKDAHITTGAVCVYPSRVKEAVDILRSLGVELPVASVATGFPSGQTHLSPRLEEIRLAVADGASEIDVVINRSLALRQEWQGVYDEVRQMREACGEAHMKVILAVGELGTMDNVYKASLVSMMAGADFIKTSTGKEAVNAVLSVGLVMVRAIRDYYQKTGYKVGFKPAGGIRTASDAINWLLLMKLELGQDWLNPQLFRIGASSVLIDIEREMYRLGLGAYPSVKYLALA